MQCQTGPMPKFDCAFGRELGLYNPRVEAHRTRGVPEEQDGGKFVDVAIGVGDLAPEFEHQCGRVGGPVRWGRMSHDPMSWEHRLGGFGPEWSVD